MSVRWGHAGVLSVVVALAACGDDASTGGGGSGAGTPQGGGGATTEGGGAEGGSGQGGSITTGGGTVGGGSEGGGGGTVSNLDDPNLDGPYTYDETDASISDTNGDPMDVHIAYPTGGPNPGPYPIVIVAHGFQLPASQYYGYAQRLASHGFVAVAPDYPTSFLGVSNVDNANDLLLAADYAASQSSFNGDGSTLGATGHSMGGKLSLLAATMEPAIKASITLDPVDSSMSCSPQDCPDVSELMPLSIPTGFIGETVDATGGFGQACAPQADNFQSFYAGTTAPSIEIEALGANHMSFLDDVASCGFTCNFCNAATADNATVNGMSKALVVAFYRRYLNGEAGYDDYLTGAMAQSRYVATGQATIQSK